MNCRRMAYNAGFSSLARSLEELLSGPAEQRRRSAAESAPWSARAAVPMPSNLFAREAITGASNRHWASHSVKAELGGHDDDVKRALLTDGRPPDCRLRVRPKRSTRFFALFREQGFPRASASATFSPDPRRSQ